MKNTRGRDGISAASVDTPNPFFAGATTDKEGSRTITYTTVDGVTVRRKLTRPHPR